MPRSRYSDRVRVVRDYSGPSRTKQAFRDECDINKIIKGYDRNGLISHLNESIPTYADLTGDEVIGGPMDYFEAHLFVQNAQAAFAGLPAELRARFKNDPGLFLAFVDDPSNRDEAVELGLVEPKDPPAEPQSEGGEPAPVPPAEPAPALVLEP